MILLLTTVQRTRSSLPPTGSSPLSSAPKADKNGPDRVERRRRTSFPLLPPYSAPSAFSFSAAPSPFSASSSTGHPCTASPARGEGHSADIICTCPPAQHPSVLSILHRHAQSQPVRVVLYPNVSCSPPDLSLPPASHRSSWHMGIVYNLAGCWHGTR